MINLPKNYNHRDAEKKWQNYWRIIQIYRWEKDLPREQTFVIDTPPPTVSGLLHMGHIFSYTQADFVARFQRMSGKTVFYPMGFDDNGLPTERLVEKEKNIRGVDMPRAEFVAQCQSVVEAAEAEFENLFNTIALSVDWNEKYQTISPKSQKISQLSFLDLHRKGLVERRLEPVLWDIVDRTALSQADLVDQEKPSQMNDIVFGIDDSDETITIATTRPELLAACVAVMVHPEDERYQHLIGKNAITALFQQKVRIIADDLVQKDKGTGAVMCCTFGDETDIKWWRKHNLATKVIIKEDGRLLIPSSFIPHAPQDLRAELDGKKIKEAREIILKILQEKNLLVKQEAIKHSVKCAERSGAPIEILVINQWFVKILHLKEQLKQKANECNWHPVYMKIRIEQWIDNLAWDWCISRQRFFGVPFPVWYSRRKGEEGKILVADFQQLPIDPLKDLPRGYSREEVIADKDVMDTWATSSISPQLSSHGITAELTLDGDLARHHKLFPADLRPQAHEIIRTWAFYTIVKAYLHEEKIPWKNLMISGWCLAADKTKMSKSKGNVITPNALIEEKGSDIVRYWASTSNLGADTAYSEDVLKIGNKLLNKLFNAAKFSAQNFVNIVEKPKNAISAVQQNLINEIFDQWILSRLSQVIKGATEQFEKFEYAKAREIIEEFFWKDLCDNYLEIAKVRSYGLSAEKYAGQDLNDAEKQRILMQQQSAALTLYYCFNAVLKLLAPFIPHITEELYQAIFAEEFAAKKSIHARGNWPKEIDFIYDETALNVGNAAVEVIYLVRQQKSEKNLSVKAAAKSYEFSAPHNMNHALEDLQNVCNTEKVTWIRADKVILTSEIKWVADKMIKTIQNNG